ncbi:MAG: prolipoprotein diacylglyceryl transferase [Myxococcota bacterium]|nr:prolipoprotein diacylglyceryl transferase [Myxococcota bacterium]
MYPVVFSTDLFGLLDKPWSLHFYGLLIAIGFMTAMLMAKRQAEREGEDGEEIVDIAFYLLLWGLVGARAIFILTQLERYMSSPLDVLMFWKGGLVFYGGIIGAAFYLIYYSRRYGLPFFKFADIFVPYLAMAAVFGRMGCLCAGCCFGKPTDLFWGIQFPVGSMAQHAHMGAGLVGVGDLSLAVHPTQLYEAGAELVLFATLAWVRGFKSFHGQLLLIWLSAYSVIRILIEIVRGDKIRGVYLLSTSQYISIGIILVAIGLLFHFRRKSQAILN